MNLQKLVSDCLSRHRNNSCSNFIHNKSHTANSLHKVPHNAQDIQCSRTNQKMHYQIHQENKENKYLKNYVSTSELIATDGVFRPQIHQLPKSLYRPTDKTECSREYIIERLLNDRRNRQNSWAKQKHQKQQTQFTNICTFKPEINPNSKKIAMKTQCTEGYQSCLDPFERLYNQGINKIRLSQTININHEASQTINIKDKISQQTSPILNQQKHPTKIKPLFQRVPQLLEEKRSYLARLTKQTNEKNEKMKEKPEINPKSAQLLQDKELFKKSILKRISTYLDEQKIKKKEFKILKKQRQLDECTFKPEINPSGILFSDSRSNLITDFKDRQQLYLQKYNNNIISRLQQEQQNNFKPKVNKISTLLVEQERAGEDFEDKINRITTGNIQKKQEKISEIQQVVYKQCTFEPKINSISKHIGQSHRHNLLEANSKTRHCCENMEQKEQQYQFKPKINKISDCLVRMRRQNGQPHTLRGSNSSLDHIKMELQYKQLKQCTFKPKTNSNQTKIQRNRKLYNNSVSHIPGFNSYSSKINKIKYQKQQIKKRQDQVFGLQKKYQPRKSTNPVQFKLSEGFNHKKALKMQAEKKFEQQCPFKPSVNQL